MSDTTISDTTMSDRVTVPTLTPINQAEYVALTNGAAMLVRPDAGVLRLTEDDRQDFLQRMTTNNIAILRPGQSAVTVLTSPTARIMYLFTVIARSNDLLLLPMPEQSSALARHLRGQIFFMDKVKVQDLSEGAPQPAAQTWSRLRVMGPKAIHALEALGIEVASLMPNAVIIQDDLLVVAQPDLEVPGYEVIVPTGNLPKIVETLVATGAQQVSDAAFDVRRVELGRPAVGTELSEEYSPLEVELAWTCAENKGCYTGQEIIARQITYDKVTKTLVGMRLQEAVTAGSEVTVEGRVVGTITSVAHSPSLDAPIALAVLKRPFNAPGTEVQIGAQVATVETLPLVEAPQ